MQAPMRGRCMHSTRRPEKSSGRSPVAARSSMHRRFSTDSSTGVPVIGTSRPESGTTKCLRLPPVPGRRTKKATGRAGSRLATGRAAHEGRRPLSVIFYQGTSAGFWQMPPPDRERLLRRFGVLYQGGQAGLLLLVALRGASPRAAGGGDSVPADWTGRRDRRPHRAALLRRRRREELEAQADRRPCRIRTLFKKVPQRKDAVDINEAILGVVILTHGEAAKNGVSVETRLADGLLLIQADRVQLQQEILNLIVNAVEAMSGLAEGSRELLISTGKDAAGGVLVTVQDSGPGLSSEACDRAFDAFYTTKAGGMGMGLSICRSIVEQHGGRIWPSRKAGPGAIILFTLPVEGTVHESAVA